MRQFAFLMLAILAVPAAAEEQAAQAPSAPRPVVSVIVSPETTLPISYVGTVVARIETDLGFPLAGTIAESPVSAGDIVQQGAVLARLDPEDLDATVRSAEASVAVATAQLRSASDARDRAKELADRGAGSETRLEDAERGLVAAEARLEQARATLAQAADMLALATLTAPQAGIVTAVFVEPGAALSAGQPVLRVAAAGEREVVIDLSEQDVAPLEEGAGFEAELVANPAVRAAATLRSIDPVAERTTRTRRLHLTLDTPPDAFRLGALARVRPVAGADAGMVLPLAAILDAESAPAVWVVDRANDTVRRASVTLGDAIADFVLIADGLDPGSEVIVKGIHSLEDGQSVGPRVPE